MNQLSKIHFYLKDGFIAGMIFDFKGILQDEVVHGSKFGDPITMEIPQNELISSFTFINKD